MNDGFTPETAIKLETCSSYTADTKIRQIIEVETAMNPKKLIGIVLATHFCNLCRIRKKDYPLRNISLKIVCKKAKKKSKKGMKLDVIRESLDDIIKTTEGSLSNFEMREYKE